VDWSILSGLPRERPLRNITSGLIYVNPTLLRGRALTVSSAERKGGVKSGIRGQGVGRKIFVLSLAPDP
jgi:hypothetical protein